MRRIGEAWLRKRESKARRLGKLDFDVSVERVVAGIKAELLLDLANGVPIDRDRYGRRDLAYMDDAFIERIWDDIDRWIIKVGEDGLAQLVQLLHGVEL